MADDALALLRCPVTRQPLQAAAGIGEFHAMQSAGGAEPLGATDIVFVTEDGQHAYPVVAGVPVLIAPERLSRTAAEHTGLDVSLPPFAESYAERALYADLAVQRGNDVLLRRLRALLAEADPRTFPEPTRHWHSGGSTAAAYAAALRHLAPVAGRTVLQIGGIGSHAIKLVHAGAARAVVVSPVIEELIEGARLAAAFGMADRMTFVAGLAEQLPLATGSVDRVYSGSSMHHTVTSQSFPEVARVLSTGGRFASVDVWRGGRLYDVGIRVFGKQHGNAYCVPLDRSRIHPAEVAFSQTSVTWHGAIARYGLALGERLGRQTSPAVAERVTGWEDRVAARLPGQARGLASIVLVRGVA